MARAAESLYSVKNKINKYFPTRTRKEGAVVDHDD